MTAEAVERSYPGLAEFRAVCDRFDPRGAFRNDYVNDVLGFDASERTERRAERSRRVRRRA